ncbi:MFS transporter [Spirochaetia bacterium]|nr:MFS transporter [Spirochaetia bacterium]
MYMIIPFFMIYTITAVVSPYLPMLIRGLGYSPSTVGLLMGVFEGAGIAGPFIFGYFADKMGRYKPGLIITAVIIVAAAIPLSFFTNPLISALFIALIAIGFRSGSPLLDAVTTISIGKNGGDYGKIRTAGSVSFVIMMFLLQSALILPPNTPRNISIWIAVTAALTTLSMIFIPSKYASTGDYAQSAGAARRAQKKNGEPPKNRKLWSVLLVLGLGMMFLNRLAMASVYSFFSLFLTESLQWNAVGFMWALATISEIPFMFLSKGLIRRFGALRILVVSALAVSLRLSIFAFFPVKTGVICAQLLHSLCYGLFHPAAVAFISSCVPPERRALGMSLYLSLGSGVPALLGNILGGIIVETSGYQALYSTFALFPLAAVGLYFIAARKKRLLQI